MQELCKTLRSKLSTVNEMNLDDKQIGERNDLLKKLDAAECSLQVS